jgi:xanthine dehydrogenase accessory factor
MKSSFMTGEDLLERTGRRDRWIAPAENVLPQLLAWRRKGLQTALVTLVGVDGSSPREIGAQMAIAEDGEAIGHISGGCLEGALIAEAQIAMAKGENRLVRYGRGSPYIDIVLPCGSGLDICFDLNPPVALVEQVLADMEARRPAVVRTDLTRGRSTLAASDDGRSPPAKSGRDKSGREGDVFVRVYQPRLRLVIVGAGPAVMTLAQLAQFVEMDVEILSPERGLTDEAARRGLSARELTAGRTPVDLKLDPWTAAIMLFHDHAWERTFLPLLLASECFYLGAVGSRKTHDARRESLARAGMTPAAMARLRAPVGLIPDVKRPAELAVSVLAEVLAEAKESGRV